MPKKKKLPTFKLKKLPKTIVYKVIITVLSLITAFLGYKQIKLNSINPAETYKVINVLDGDTFVVGDYHQRIRLYGVQAPELKYPYGKESKEFLESLVKDKEVYFKNIVADKYGRIIALAYVDDLLVNQEMIRQGYAEADGHRISESPELFKDAEKLATNEGLGIFSSEFTQMENMDNPECSIKGNIRKGKKTYLFPSCRSYNLTIIEKHKGELWFCSEKEAKKAGFLKPSACFGKSFKK